MIADDIVQREGWIAPNGDYYNNKSLDHSVKARQIIAKLHFDEADSNEMYTANGSQSFLLRKGYIRIDVEQITWNGDLDWGLITKQQVRTLQLMLAARKQSRFFPRNVVRLMLVRNGVSELREDGDEQLFAQPVKLEAYYRDKK